MRKTLENPVLPSGPGPRGQGGGEHGKHNNLPRRGPTKTSRTGEGVRLRAAPAQRRGRAGQIPVDLRLLLREKAAQAEDGTNEAEPERGRRVGLAPAR